jgi:hypothetical protein
MSFHDGISHMTAAVERTGKIFCVKKPYINIEKLAITI